MDFTSSTPIETTPLTRRVFIGFEHDVVSSDAGDELDYKLDDDGERIKRSYVVPVRLAAREVIGRSKTLDPSVVQGLISGDLESLIELLDVMVGGDIIEAVGTDRSVSTDEFLRFVMWLVDELHLTDVLGGGPGN